MKSKIYLFVFFISTLLSLSSCEEDAFFNQIYLQAYKGKTPLENLMKVTSDLEGAWMIKESDKETPIIIEKKDDYHYNIRLLTKTLENEDAYLSASLSNFEGVRFLNILTPKGDYIYLRALSIVPQGTSLGVVKQSVSNQLDGASLSEWITEKVKNKAFYANDAIYETHFLNKTSKKQVLSFQQTSIKENIKNLDGYNKYASKFPEDPGLVALRKSVVEFEIDHCDNITCLSKLTRQSPDVKGKAIEKAQEYCKTTKDYIELVTQFQRYEEQYIKKAFELAKNMEDYRMLLKTFPKHPLAIENKEKLFYMEVAGCNNNADYEKLLERYSSDEGMKKRVMALIIFNNLPFDKITFYPNSHILTSQGKEALDQIVTYINKTRQSPPGIKHLYISLEAKGEGIEPNPMADFKLALNRCWSLKKYIESKRINAIVHFIPSGSEDGEGNNVKMAPHGASLKPAKEAFQSQCINLNQTFIVPNNELEYVPTQYWQEKELREAIIQAIPQQVEAYKNNVHYTKIIPVHFWYEKFRPLNPDFESFKEKLIKSARSSRLSKKKVQDLVVTLED